MLTSCHSVSSSECCVFNDFEPTRFCSDLECNHLENKKISPCKRSQKSPTTDLNCASCLHIVRSIFLRHVSLDLELNYHGCGDTGSKMESKNTEHNTSLRNTKNQKLPIPRSRSIQVIFEGVVEHLHSGRSWIPLLHSLWRTKFLKSKISPSLCQLASLLHHRNILSKGWLSVCSVRSHFRLSLPHLWGVEAFAYVQVSSSKLESQQTQERCCGHNTNANIQRTFHKPQESNNSTGQ